MKYSFVAMVIALLVPGAAMVSGQGTVPAGIHYQAVARDNNGKELTGESIDVRFSIHSGTPEGSVVYQELHSGVVTTKYGVFSLIIGQGTRVGGTAASFGEIDWSSMDHYLQVEVKFDNLFMNMGTMQFMAVPYALYAGKSLEAGPVGPAGPKGDKGDPGDPASDDQTLSVVNVDGSDYLAISGGNQVKISSIERDGDPTNELQSLNYNATTRALSITGGNSVSLGTEVAFRARNLVSDGATWNTDVTMTYDAPDLNIGGGFNPGTGIFTAPADGIYTFNISYFADGTGGSRGLFIHVNSALYEKIAIEIASLSEITVRSVTIRLSAGNTVSVVVYTGTATQTGTGSFSGYKVD